MNFLDPWVNANGIVVPGAGVDDSLCDGASVVDYESCKLQCQGGYEPRAPSLASFSFYRCLPEVLP